MTIAFDLYAYDNDSYMLDQNKQKVCPDCELFISPKIDFSFDLKVKDFDLSYTYDGYMIVSELFKEFCETEKYSGIEFIKISTEGFFLFECSNTIAFDSKRRKTRFVNFCNTCNQHHEIIGASPVYLKDVKESLHEGFYRTDLEFGSGNNKHPVIMTGLDTYKKMRKKHFTGYECNKVES